MGKRGKGRASVGNWLRWEFRGNRWGVIIKDAKVGHL